MGPNPNGPYQVSCDRANRYSGFFRGPETVTVRSLEKTLGSKVAFGGIYRLENAEFGAPREKEITKTSKTLESRTGRFVLITKSFHFFLVILKLRFQSRELLLMEEILHHLGCTKPCK